MIVNNTFSFLCSLSLPSVLWAASTFTATSPSAAWLPLLLNALLMSAMGRVEGDRSGELLTSAVLPLLCCVECSLWPLLRRGWNRVNLAPCERLKHLTFQYRRTKVNVLTYSSAALRFLISSLSVLFSFFRLFISPASPNTSNAIIRINPGAQIKYMKVWSQWVTRVREI